MHVIAAGAAKRDAGRSVINDDERMGDIVKSVSILMVLLLAFATGCRTQTLHEAAGAGDLTKVALQALAWDFALAKRPVGQIQSGTQEIRKYGRGWNRAAGQGPHRLTYESQPIGEHRLDLLVAERVVVDLKAIKALEPVHVSVVRSYMKATNVDSGLLLNFAAMPLTVKRVGREHPNPS